MSDTKKALANQLVNPIVVIDKLDEARLKYWMQLSALDPMIDDPIVWGPVVSDLIHNIAACYVDVRGGDVGELRSFLMDAIVKANQMRDEAGEEAKVTVFSTGKPSKMN